eukprot:11594470-Alexandrium_andersonii.AAC.1
MPRFWSADVQSKIHFVTRWTLHHSLMIPVPRYVCPAMPAMPPPSPVCKGLAAHRCWPLRGVPQAAGEER